MTDFLLRDSRSPGMVLHPSTEAALAALRELHRPPPGISQVADHHNILDLGCGSGLLSLAASELWPQARILASDISPQAVLDARENVRNHGLDERIRVIRADGYRHALIEAGAPYDLIVCNLLADILIKTAADLKQHLAPGGVAVLSGILAWIYPQVCEAHAALGFEIAGEIEIGEWRAVVVA